MGQVLAFASLFGGWYFFLATFKRELGIHDGASMLQRPRFELGGDVGYSKVLRTAQAEAREMWIHLLIE